MRNLRKFLYKDRGPSAAAAAVFSGVLALSIIVVTASFQTNIGPRLPEVRQAAR